MCMLKLGKLRRVSLLIAPNHSKFTLNAFMRDLIHTYTVPLQLRHFYLEMSEAIGMDCLTMGHFLIHLRRIALSNPWQCATPTPSSDWIHLRGTCFILLRMRQLPREKNVWRKFSVKKPLKDTAGSNSRPLARRIPRSPTLNTCEREWHKPYGLRIMFSLISIALKGFWEGPRKDPWLSRLLVNPWNSARHGVERLTCIDDWWAYQKSRLPFTPNYPT